MPWFPDFVAAADLARREVRAAGRADPVPQYVTAPILEPGRDHPGDVVGRYEAALRAGDADAIVSTFATDGCLRESIGPHSLLFGAAEWGSHDLPPQAGITVFERGRDGLLAAARVYDDVEAPVDRSQREP